MDVIRTPRLALVPATAALLDAELRSREALADLLGADVPADWPPGEHDRDAVELFRARLAERPDAAGWYGWYALLPGPGGSVLIGSGGFLGPPGADGTVEIGYSIVPTYRRRGFATELVRALVDRALSTAGVARVVAHTTPANVGSVKVLERCGFRHVGPGDEPGSVRYAVARRGGPTVDASGSAGPG
ncbi:MAG TPA: GNAT family protein [Actinomycetota bacterium]|nr:GNAT family protein [Actinomycetota bacterium]